MEKLSELVLYNLDGSVASDDDYEFYYEDLSSARKSLDGIIVGIITPDYDCGHVEFWSYKTWCDVDIALRS